MTSLHRRFPGWLSHDPDGVMSGNAAALHPCVLSLHYTTARPLAVRIRVPLALAAPDYVGPGNWATWPCERYMLKASAWVLCSKFGVGDVRVGSSSGGHWMAELRQRATGHIVVIGTSPLFVRDFIAATERLAPVGHEAVDVDGLIADLLGSAS